MAIVLFIALNLWFTAMLLFTFLFGGISCIMYKQTSLSGKVVLIVLAFLNAYFWWLLLSDVSVDFK